MEVAAGSKIEYNECTCAKCAMMDKSKYQQLIAGQLQRWLQQLAAISLVIICKSLLFSVLSLFILIYLSAEDALRLGQDSETYILAQLIYLATHWHGRKRPLVSLQILAVCPTRPSSLSAAQWEDCSISSSSSPPSVSQISLLQIVFFLSCQTLSPQREITFQQDDKNMYFAVLGTKLPLDGLKSSCPVATYHLKTAH